jgi:hypothetical protein
MKITLQDFKKISDYEWEIPATFRKDMRVPVKFFATRRLLEAALDDRSVQQGVNAATLPGLVGSVLVMPDVHQGYGFPIGGVAATRLPDGVISPGGIGYDINCGVRLLGSIIPLGDVENQLDDLASALNEACPSGWRWKLICRTLKKVGAWMGRTQKKSVNAPGNAGERSWAPWEPAIILSRLIMWSRYTMALRLRPWAWWKVV